MKAQGMSIGVVITAALAVMVLLMVGGFMSGGFSALTGKITGFVGSGPSAEETGKAAGCSAACTAWKAAGCKDDGMFTQMKTTCGCKTETLGAGTYDCAGTAGACTCKDVGETGGGAWGK